jgi:hypothetical protein
MYVHTYIHTYIHIAVGDVRSFFRFAPTRTHARTNMNIMLFRLSFMPDFFRLPLKILVFVRKCLETC